jgi:hypothetical protein
VKNNAPAATKAEKDRIKRLFLEVGCICCLLRFGLKNSHIEIHHIVRGNKRLGHWYTLPLCHSHHQQKDKGAWTSIANGRKAFNAIHGTELDLWLKCQHMLGLPDDLPATKVLPRRVALPLRALSSDEAGLGEPEGVRGGAGSGT